MVFPTTYEDFCRTQQRRAPYALKPARLRAPTRAWRAPALVDAVRVLVITLRDEGSDQLVSADRLARALRAKKGMVTAALHKLAHEGLIGHKVRSNGIFGKGRSFWRPSFYTILPDKRDQ